MAAAHATARPVAAPARPTKSASAVRPAVQDGPSFIPAQNAFTTDPTLSGCSDGELDDETNPARLNPEWTPINSLNLDPVGDRHIFFDQPTILEGFVVPATGLGSKDQSTSEVSEEDIPWNHFTHDFTVKVTPDAPYQNLLSSWVRFPGVTFPINSPADAGLCTLEGGRVDGNTCIVREPDSCPGGDTTSPTCHHTDMEVEWENASLMDEGEGFQRIWGSVPEFAWPAGGDRVWVMGRWIFDCGHPRVPDGVPQKQFVQYQTEIHPPRALVTFRLNHPALDSFPVPRVSAPSFAGPQSILPVTGLQATLPPDVPNNGPTNVPVTEADVFVTGNGGQANDLCMIRATNADNDCKVPHTLSVLPVNDRNYVFDIYPPGTDYNFDHREDSGAFKVFPPVADASLQWRVENHFSELPTHTCGSTSNSTCVTVEPIFCLVDKDTTPPDQTETSCPALNGPPTHLRVILPFAGSNANFFARSILLGWDDVPFSGSVNFPVRTFKITLHKLTVVLGGFDSLSSHFPGDWRVFVNVGGQYRYVDHTYDRNADGSNKCSGPGLPSASTGDCFFFDETPWIVSVQNFNPIHVAVGGFLSAGVDDDFCRKFLTADTIKDAPKCDPFGVDDTAEVIAENSSRIGDYEFDLDAGRNYQWVDNQGNPITSHTNQPTDSLQAYNVEFHIEEIPAPTPPVSNPIQVGDPHFGNFVSSATPVLLASASPDAEGFQYRSYLQGGPLPVYPAAQPFPVHWTHADLPAGSQSVPVFLTGTDGANLLQFSAESFANLLEPRHTETLILDNTPPVINIVQPQPATYTHNAVLTLDYSVNDGAGSGIGSVTPTMDGASTLPGGVGLQSGQQIRLLKELRLGTHTFTVSATDRVNNNGAVSVPFIIVVTAASIKDDVQQFLQDDSIKNSGLANSMLAKLNQAGDALGAGQCSQAAQHYQVFIHEVEAQSGKGISADAAAIMIADAQFLIAHCP